MKPNIPNDGFSPAPVPEGMNAPAVPLLPQGPAPEPKFEDSVCLKGNEGGCEHLWQLVTSYAHGNTAGTFKEGDEPKAIHRSCLRSPSHELDLKGMTIFSCSKHSDPKIRKDPKPFVFDEPEGDPKLANLPTVRLNKEQK